MSNSSTYNLASAVASSSKSSSRFQDDGNSKETNKEFVSDLDEYTVHGTPSLYVFIELFALVSRVSQGREGKVNKGEPCIESTVKQQLRPCDTG